MKWTEKLRTQIARMYNEGLSFRQIASAVGIESRASISGVVGRMIAAGDDRIVRGVSHDWTDKESLALLDMRENKQMCFRQIAAKLGRQPRECSKHYADILRDLRQSEAA